MRPVDWSKIDVLDEEAAERYRRMSVTERVALALDANRKVRCILYSYLQSTHSDWDDGALRREIARRMLSDDLAGLYR